MNQIHRIYEVEAKDIDTAKMKAVAKAFQEFDSRHNTRVYPTFLA